MRSSYKNSVDYSDIFKTICFIKKPNLIIEFGILDGFSLKAFGDSCPSNTIIKAFDIFEDFNGNGSKRDIINKFQQYQNIEITYGDYYTKFSDFQDNTIDILHIDIANCGDTYEFMFQYYLPKLKEDGIILLEGGSEQRDKVEWMKKYNKTPITHVIQKYNNQFNIKVISDFPSLTLVKKSGHIPRQH
jgi:predicted O-methyltransferase YrrM